MRNAARRSSIHSRHPVVRGLRAGLVRAAALAAALAAAAPARAADPNEENLAELTLEQLASIQVTSVSRRPERMSDVAAAIYVITAEDIRRAGAITLPEALRLAPNLAVARADANQYAIAARAFNSTLANKMLVMIDGRTVYSPLFSGVFWEVQDILLEDVDRIEVVSGPGGTFWGTNAVHGVIHVLTKSAEQTQGPLIALGAGSDVKRGVARGGTTLGERGYLRVYGQYTDQDHTTRPGGASVRDRSNRAQGGFRADWRRDTQSFTLSGDAYTGDIEQVAGSRVVGGANLTASWMRAVDDGRDFRVQAFFDHAERDPFGSVRDVLNTWDLEAQRALRPGAALDLLVGAGWRYQDDRLRNPASGALAFVPANQVLRTLSAFAQADLELGARGDLSLGLKVEHNDYTGAELLPNLRLGFKPTETGLLWGQIARNVRAPSRLDRELYVPAQPDSFHLVIAGTDFEAEVSNAVEAGWRGQPSTALSWSVVGYHHRLEKLRSLRPTPAGNVLDNQIEGGLTGVGTWLRYRVNRWWRLTAGLVEQRLSLRTEPGATDFSGLGALGNDANRFASLGSSIDFGGVAEAHLQLRHVGKLPHPEVPAYTSADLRLGVWLGPDLELSVTGTNLLESRHAEWGVPATRPGYQRGVHGKVVWHP